MPVTDHTASAILEQFADDMAGMLKVAAADFDTFVRDGDIHAKAAAFLASGDDTQLAVIGFRLRQFARRHQIEAIKRASETLEDILLFGLRAATTAIAAL